MLREFRGSDIHNTSLDSTGAGARSGEGRLYLVTSIEQLRQLLPLESYPLRTELLGLTLITILFDSLSALECKQNLMLWVGSVHAGFCLIHRID